MSSIDIDNNINDILSNKPPVFLNKAINFLSQHLEEAQSHSRFYEISEANIKKILDKSDASELTKKSILSKIGTSINENKTVDLIKLKPTVSPPQTRESNRSIERNIYKQTPNQQKNQIENKSTLQSNNTSNSTINRTSNSTINRTSNSTINRTLNSTLNNTSNSTSNLSQIQMQLKDSIEENKRLQKTIDKLEDDKRMLNKRIDDLEDIVNNLKKSNKSGRNENNSANDEQLKNAYSIIEKNKKESALNMIEKEKLELKIKYLQNENYEISNKSSILAVANKELQNKVNKQDQLIFELQQKNENDNKNKDYTIQQLTNKYEHEKQVLEQDLRNQIDELSRQLDEYRNNATNQIANTEIRAMNPVNTNVQMNSNFSMGASITMNTNGSMNSVSVFYSSYHYESI